jgi:hypothetical protein
VTTPNRKRVRLLEKLRGLNTELLSIKVAPKGSSNSTSADFDPAALYVSKRTLIHLLEEGWAPGELTDVVEPEKVCAACSGSGYYDADGSPPCGSCNGTGTT